MSSSDVIVLLLSYAAFSVSRTDMYIYWLRPCIRLPQMESGGNYISVKRPSVLGTC